MRGRLEESAGAHRAGAAYDANRPDLLLWVHATLVTQSLRAHPLFVAPLSPAEREQYHRESRLFARLFGVPDAVIPRDLAAFEAWFEGVVAETLAVGPCGMRLRRALLGGIPWSWPLAPAGFLLAGGLLPPQVRELFELPWNRAMQLAFDATATATRRALPHLPDRVRFDARYLRARRRLA